MAIVLNDNTSTHNKQIKPFLSRDSKRIFHIYFTNPKTGKRTKKSTKTAVRTKAENELDKFMRNLGSASLAQVLPRDLRIKDLELLLFSANSNTKSPKSHELNKLAFKHLIAAIGNKLVHEITRVDADFFMNSMVGKVALTTLNIYLRQLKWSFGKAVIYDLIPYNQFQNAKQLIVPDKLRPNISEEDISKLISEMEDEFMIRLTKFAFLTAMRLSEIVNLQWSDIDLENNTIHIQNKNDFITKTRKNRDIALTPMIKELLLNSPDSETGNIVKFRNPKSYVFGNKNGFRFTPNYISHKFKKYVRMTDLNPRICFHALRHGSLTAMSLSGVPIRVLQEIAGHSDINTTEKYLHSNIEQVRHFMEKVDYGF